MSIERSTAISAVAVHSAKTLLRGVLVNYSSSSASRANISLAVISLSIVLHACCRAHGEEIQPTRDNSVSAKQAGEIWKYLTQSVPTVDSANGDSFAFEVVVVTNASGAGNAVSEFKRTQLLSESGRVSMRIIDRSGFPVYCAQGQTSYALQADGAWERSRGRWSFAATMDSLAQMHRMDEDADRSSLRVDLTSILRGIFGEVPDELSYDAACHALQVTRSDGTAGTIWLNSPEVQLQIGSLIAEFIVKSPDSRQIAKFSGISRVRDGYPSFNLSLRDDFDLPLPVDSEHRTQGQFSFIESQELAKASREFWKSVSAYRPAEVMKSGDTSNAFEQLSSADKGMTLVSLLESNPPSVDLTTLVCNELLGVLGAIEGSLRDRLGGPSQRWRLAEEAVGAAELRAIADLGWKLAGNGFISKPQKMRLIQALALLGQPPYLITTGGIDELPLDRPIEREFLRASWLIPLDENVEEECQAVFRTYRVQSPESLAAVEIMLRTRGAKDILEAALTAWYDSVTREIDNVPGYYRALTLLSSSEFGTDFLTRRAMQSPPDSQESRKIIEFLEQRVAAVQECGRYDVLSHARCALIKVRLDGLQG